MNIRWIIGAIVLAGILALAMFVYMQPGGQQTRQFDNLPWQVQVVDEQRTRVLGITLGETTMADLMGYLPVPEIRMFVDPDGTRSVEAYYVNARIEPFETNLILRPDLGEQELDRIEAGTTSERPMPSGARRYGLDDDTLGTLGNVPVVEMSYIPRARWDGDLLRRHFGEPAERMQIDSNHSYWLYPDRGVAVLLPDRGRPTMHYTTQERWSRVEERLQDEGRRRLGEEDHQAETP